MARPRPYLHTSPPRLTGAGALPVRDADGRPLIRLQTLGAATILVGEVRLTAAAGTLFSLLLRLTGTPGMQLPRDVLRRSLWPDQADVRQRANLRQALYKLRGYGVQASMHGDVVAMDPAQVVRTFSLDRSTETFERDVTMGHEPFGTFLPGFAVPWPELQEWIDQQREAVHADVRRVLAEQLRRRRARADWGGADALARWLLQFDPLNEEATLTVAECTLLSGSKREAIAILDRYLAELGPGAGDLRLQATMLRRRIAEPAARSRLSFAPTERHFVGRETELADLTLAMRRARWHDGSAELLHGPPGIGKSRLAHELEKVAAIEGVRVAQASCRESDLLRPLSVFLDLVPELLSRPGALGSAPESLAALRRLAAPDRSVAATSGVPPMPAGGDMPGAPSPNAAEGAAMREPMPMAASLRRAIIDLLAAVSEEKPLLLVVEDVHWIDEHSWEVLSDLADRTGAMRVFLLLTSREPHARPHRPQRVPLALRVRALPPLSSESCLVLSRAIGDDLSAPVSDELGGWFVNASEGNPLFLRALVNHWIETGEAGGVPPTLQGVIEQRLSQVSGDALRVLQTAALLGKWATGERVAKVLEIEFPRLLKSADELSRLGALKEAVGIAIEVHELVRRVALSSMSSASQRLLRSRIASALSAAPCFPQVHCELEVLDHYANAGEGEKAVEFAANAVRTLLEIDLPHRAIAVCDHAMIAFPTLASEQRFLSLRRDSLYSAGQYSRLLADHTWDDLSATASGTWDHLNARDVIRMVEIADRAMYIGDFVDLCSRGLLIAKTPTVDARLRLRAAIAVIRASSMGVDKQIPESAYAVGLTISENGQAMPYAADELDMYFHTGFGQHEVAVASAKRLVRTAKSRRTPSDQVRILGDCAYSFMCAGLLSESDALFQETLREALQHSILTRASTAAFNRSMIAIALNQLDIAELHALEARRIAASAADPFLEALAVRNLARIAQLAGDFSRARALLEDAGNQSGVAAHPKWYAFGIALRLGLAIGERDIHMIRELLPAALGELSSLQATLGQDFLASRVVLGQIEVSDVQSAKATLAEYLRVHRREAFAPPHFLRLLHSDLMNLG